MTRAAAIALLVILGGCNTMLSGRDHADCLSYGFPEGSPAYGDCRLALRSNRTNAIRGAVLSQPTYQQTAPSMIWCNDFGSSTLCQ